jgi:hypothetical protein
LEKEERKEKNSPHPGIKKPHLQSLEYLPRAWEFGIKWKDTIQLKCGWD